MRIHIREKYSWLVNSNSIRIHMRQKIPGNSKCIYSRWDGPCLVGVENRRAFRLSGAGGDHVHCAVEPSPGHIRSVKLRSGRHIDLRYLVFRCMDVGSRKMLLSRLRSCCPPLPSSVRGEPANGISRKHPSCDAILPKSETPICS